METIVLCDEAQTVHTFTRVEAAIAYVNQNRGMTLTVYANQSLFEQLHEATVGVDNRSDYNDLSLLRGWKVQASGWGDIEELNDSRDTIHKRISRREKQLRFGGEIYKEPE